MEIAIPAPEVIGQLEERLIGEFALAVQERSSYISTLSKWEDDQLLDNPNPESLAAHKRMVERLLAFGGLLSVATAQREFPDRKTAEIVSATQATLQDKLLMWHRPRMNREDADRI